MGKNKKYWTGLDELDQTPAFQNAISAEFLSDQPEPVMKFLSEDKLKEISTGRRDFLKFMGFSVAAAALASCETPVVKSIPYVVKPEDIVPGIANYYASTYYDGNDFGNILVKTREGRPIFIKGNPEFGIAKGAISSRINASVLGLYDGSRLRNSKKGSSDISWDALDKEMGAALASASSIRILSNTIISPSTQRAINEFSAKYAGKVKHVQYDTYSYSGITKANQVSFQKAVVPSYDFSKAKVIVSIAADFLGTWITPSVYQTGYTEARQPENGWMSKHYQFESVMSLSGSNCDERFPIKPSQEGKVAAALYNTLTGGTGGNIDGVDSSVITRIAADLKAHSGESLVIAGSNDVNVQMIVNAINQTLGNYGKTIDINNSLNLFRGNDEEVNALVDEMNSGAVEVLLLYGVNPSYSLPDTNKFNAGLAKVKTSVSFNLFADETASRCTYIAPDHHYLESWNDYSVVKGRTDLAQPAITPLYSTRYAQESFLRWAGNSSAYYDYLRTTYNGAYTPALMKSDTAWYMAVHNGTFAGAVADEVTDVTAAALPVSVAGTAAPAPVVEVASAIAAANSKSMGEWEAVFYQKITMGLGNHANNPMLQETPDPITKVTWDNYVTMSPSDAKEKGLVLHLGQNEEASLVRVTINGKDVTLPVFAAPGQKRGTIGIALGYGRGSGNEEIGKAAYQNGPKGEHLMDGDKRLPIGKNVFQLATIENGQPLYVAYSAAIEPTGETYPLASTQMHNTVMGRDSVVKETTISNYLKEKDKKKGTATWNTAPTLVVHADVNGDGEINAKDRQPTSDSDMWRAHPVEGVGHRWGMTIDLGACIGCGACITACHIENNVPVVGKDEVLRHRDMHWMRIDRYFSSDYETLEETKEKKQLGTIAAYSDMENAAENPRTVHMPMMCQHCNHAPCETVCPVAATSHSDEGLNNMAYNRCIGTRYCANNCPYKVRRFNWLNYVTNDKFAMVNPAQDETLRMVLNPDVTVRGRGVMEKCSMCQQRIQEGKLEAKKAGTPVADGAIQTACAEACPTHAIVFGDLNDRNTINTKRSENNRSYHALEEIGIKPNIFYMTKVRNIEETEA
ncbi:MAG: TAT-variant-translocated molybdopterin oxidoreductase [Crocinitomicaceae bacterium]|nr:TAT-variant-translocated molybdopterin oxidoreductase [Crocinitomicaceae bacterium]